MGTIEMCICVSRLPSIMFTWKSVKLWFYRPYLLCPHLATPDKWVPKMASMQQIQVPRRRSSTHLLFDHRSCSVCNRFDYCDYCSSPIWLGTVSFHNFKSRKFKLSVSNPKSKYFAYLFVLSQISNCQGLGRKNKHEILKTDRTHLALPDNIFKNASAAVLTARGAQHKVS